MEYIQRSFTYVNFKNIPTKTIKYDNKLPWISNELRKQMNKYRHQYVNGNQNKNRKVKSSKKEKSKKNKD